MDIPTTTNFCPVCDAEAELPTDLFGGMLEMPKLISRSFKEPRSVTPDAGWTPHEIAAHLADVEVVLGWRIRQVLVNKAPTLEPFDQDAYAANLAYGSRELATSLATYAANRQSNIELLRRAGEPGMQRLFKHPEFGDRELGILVRHIADHDIAHLKQIRGD
jgi:hypothetical protein